jgi:PAS domain S-box-containing protein
MHSSKTRSALLKSWPSHLPRSPVTGYVLAVLITAAALGVRLWLEPLLGDRIPFATFFAALALTAWFGGAGPCLVSIVLSALAAWYFVLEPHKGMAPYLSYQTLGLTTFVLTGLVIAAFSGRMRYALQAMHATQREAEHRAHEAEEGRRILNTLLANVPEGITMAGGPPDFPIVAQSRFAEELIGPTARQSLGVSAGEHIFRSGIYRPDGITVPAREEVPLYRATRYGETVKNEQWVLARHDGGHIHVLVDTVPIKDADGAIVGGIGCWRDVTEQRTLVEALAESEQRFRATFEQAAMGLAHVDLDGKWLRVNDRLCQMTGFGRDALIGRRLQEITYADDAQNDHEQMQSLLAGRIASYSIEKRYLRSDLSVLWIALTAALVRKDGEPQYFILVVEDIGQRKAVEAEILRLNDELEKRVEERTAELLGANRELESFSYSVSHDLRAPLRSIEGFSRIVLEDNGERLTQESRDHLTRVVESTKHMGKLIDHLLEFSRLGRKTLATQLTDLRAIALICVDELMELNRDRTVNVSVDPLPDCRCDAALMRHVFANLLSNAFKFTRETTAPRIRVGYVAQEGYPIIYVQDNGLGFDMRYIDKIFGVFERLHRAEDYEGTGVGLAIVKRIIERHGGRIWAQSNPGQGATFYFTLPSVQPTVA